MILGVWGGESEVQGEPGLHSEFEDTYSQPFVESGLQG